MKDMIAYCGLNCEKCDAYLATIRDDQKLREETAKLWSKLNNITILPEQINCEGCRINGIKTPYCNSLCPIRKCALEKNISMCSECIEFNKCEMVKSIVLNDEAK